MKYVPDIRAEQFRELSQYEVLPCQSSVLEDFLFVWADIETDLQLVASAINHSPLKFTNALSEQLNRNMVFFSQLG